MQKTIEFLHQIFNTLILFPTIGEKYVTITSVIPLVGALLRSLDQVQANTMEGKLFAKRILRIAGKRLLLYETRTICCLGTLLDPRYKKKAFVFSSNADESVKLLKQTMVGKMKKIAADQNVSSEAANSVPEAPNFASVPKTSILLSFLEQVPEKVSSNLNNFAAQSETVTANYFARNKAPLTADPILYWAEDEYKSTAIQQIAYEMMCVPATSVPVERLFSEAGYTVTSRRNRLKPFNVQMLVSLHHNFEFVRT